MNKNALITYIALGVIGIALLLFAIWALVPVSLSASVKDGAVIDPNTRQIVINSNLPLSGAAANSVTLSPASAKTASLKSTLRGLDTRLVITFTTQLTADTDYLLTVRKKGWVRDDGLLTIRFHTQSQGFNSINESGGQNQGELENNPILNLLPYDADHYSVEWNTSNDKGQYIFDVIVYVEPGQTPQQAANLYGPAAAQWIKSTGQPSNTYVIRYSTQPQSAHP